MKHTYNEETDTLEINTTDMSDIFKGKCFLCDTRPATKKNGNMCPECRAWLHKELDRVFGPQ